MATVTVKNIPDELYARLKSVAAMNRRSINSEIIMCIDRAVVSRPIDPAKVLEDARQLRKFSANHPIEDEEFNQAKAKGAFGCLGKPFDFEDLKLTMERAMLSWCPRQGTAQ